MRANYLEDSMGAGWSRIRLSRLSRSITITVDQQVQNFLSRVDLYFLEASDHNSFLRILSQLKIAIRGILVRSTWCVNQVTDVLVVDLEEGDFDFISAVHFEVF